MKPCDASASVGILRHNQKLNIHEDVNKTVPMIAYVISNIFHFFFIYSHSDPLEELDCDKPLAPGGNPFEEEEGPEPISGTIVVLVGPA